MSKLPGTNHTLMTVAQFSKACNGAWPSESCLRALIYRSTLNENNFKNCFFKVGKRVLVDPVEFWKCAKTDNHETIIGNQK